MSKASKQHNTNFRSQQWAYFYTKQTTSASKTISRVQKTSTIKYEYIDGEVYAMACVSKNHQRLIGNVFSALHAQLKNTPCEVFNSDIKVRPDSGNKYFYPDVLVVCDDDNTDEYYTQSSRANWTTPSNAKPIKTCPVLKNMS